MHSVISSQSAVPPITTFMTKVIYMTMYDINRHSAADGREHSELLRLRREQKHGRRLRQASLLDSDTGDKVIRFFPDELKAAI